MTTYNGSTGPDAYTGTASSDFINGNGGDDTLDGAGGNDGMNGGPGDDIVYGGDGDDTLSGFAGADSVYGGAGADRLTTSTGAFLDGGADDDEFWLQGAPAGIFGGDGVDTLRPVNASTLGVFGAANGFERYSVTGNSGISGTTGDDDIDFSGLVSVGSFGLRFVAGAGADAVTGLNDRGDTLSGDAGADSLSGGAGNDTLNGGADDDWIRGGSGDDSLNGGTQIDTADYGDAASGVTVAVNGALQSTGGAGVDSLAGFENLSGSDFSDQLSGDALANRLRGGDGRDRLKGSDGEDTLIGGEGADKLKGGKGADVFVVLTLKDSKIGRGDLISDFGKGGADRLDVSSVDAVAGGADDAFTLVDAFSGSAGELVVIVGVDSRSVQGDIDGDGAADFAVELSGIGLLTIDDFIL